MPPPNSIHDALDDQDDLEQHEVVSCWRSMRAATVEHATQTKAIAFQDQGTQIMEKQHMATQCEKQPISASELNPEKAEALLKTVLPLLTRILEQNSTSTWHEQEQSLMQQEQELALHHSCTLSHALKHEHAITPLKAQESSSVICSSYNCNATLLIQGLGCLTHTQWCTHTSHIFIWSLYQRNFNPQHAQRSIELSSCLSFLAPHPSKPFVLAYGLYNGQVIVEDLNDTENSTLFSTQIDDLHHREAILSITWLNDTTLVASSTDGKILTWSISFANSDATDNQKDAASAVNAPAHHPIHGQIVTPSTTYHGKGAVTNRYPTLGISSFALQCLDRSIFVVSTSAGGLIHGKLHDVKESNRLVAMKVVQSGEHRWTKEAYNLLDDCSILSKFECKAAIEKAALLNGHNPIDVNAVFASRVPAQLLYKEATLFAYSGHDGPISSVQFSPFSPSLFASVSYDGTMRLWRVNERECILAVIPVAKRTTYLYAVAWSSTRPCVLACTASNGQTYVYDLSSDALLPALTIDHSNNGSCNHLSFPSQEPSSLVGSIINTATTLIWQLSDSLIELRSNEMEILHALEASSARNS